MKPYHIFTGLTVKQRPSGPRTSAVRHLGYRDRLLGFVELTLPTGVVAIAGFAVSFTTLMQMGQGRRYHGRESACVALRSWYGAYVTNPGEPTMLEGGGASGSGEVKWMMPPKKE